MTETTSAGELNSCSTSWCVQPQAALSSSTLNFYSLILIILAQNSTGRPFGRWARPGVAVRCVVFAGGATDEVRPVRRAFGWESKRYGRRYDLLFRCRWAGNSRVKSF